MTLNSKPFIPLVTLMMTLLGATAMGQDPPPIGITEVGGPFRLNFAPGIWAQRVVSVTNSTEAPRPVKVVYATDIPGRGETHFTRTFDVPARSVRKVELAICPGAAESPPAAAPAASRAMLEQIYVLYDGAGSQKLAQLPVQVQRVPQRALAVGLITGAAMEAGDEYGYLVHREEDEDDSAANMQVRGGATRPASLPGPLGAADVLSLNEYSGRPTILPSRWYGYSLLDIMILIDVDYAAWPLSQREALTDWVRRGGVLVLAGGRGLAESLAGELAELAGVAACGSHYVTRMDVTQSDAPAIARPLSWPLPMAELTPLDADVLARCNGMPLLARRSLGQGTVFTLAMPVAALRDPSLHGLWRKVKAARETPPAIAADRFIKPAVVDYQAGRQVARLDQQYGKLSPAAQVACRSIQEDLRAFQSPARMALQAVAGRRGPMRAVAVGILLALAAAVAAGGWLLHRRRRGELLWLALTPLAIAASVGFYVAGRAGGDSERLSFVGLVTPLGDGQVRVQEACGYYTGPQSRRQSFDAGSPRAVPASLESASALSLSTVQTGPTLTLGEESLPPNYTKAFSVDTTVSSPGLSTSLSFDEAGLAGTIRNDLGFALSDCVVYADRRTYRLGALPQGVTTVAVGAAQRLGTVEYVRLQEAIWTLGDTTRTSGTRPARGVRRPLDIPPMVDGVPLTMLVNFGRGEFTSSPMRGVVETLRNRVMGQLVPVPPPGRTAQSQPLLIGYGEGSLLDPLGRPVPRQGWSAVVWPLDIQPPPAGRRVTIPSGLAVVRLEATPVSLYSVAGHRFNPVVNNAAAVVRVQPPLRRPLEDAKVTLTIQAQAKDFRLLVSGLDGEGGSIPLAAVERPGGSWTVTVEGAQRFAAGDGTMSFLVKFEAIDPRVNPAAGENTCTAIDVDLEGTPR